MNFETADKAFHHIRDNADRMGQLRGHLELVNHKIKIELAQGFLNATGTVMERESQARTSDRYGELVNELHGVTTELHTLQTEIKAAELAIAVWQTKSANDRRAHV